MKTRIFLLFSALFMFSSLQAQWNSLQGPAFTNTDPSARIGIGADSSQSKLFVLQSSNDHWAAHIENKGGFGKGLIIECGGSWNDNVPVLRTESWNDGHPGLTVLSNGNVGIGAGTSQSRLLVSQSSNDHWAAHIENKGGFGSGLLIKAGYNGNDNVPVLQAESWNNGYPGLTVWSNGNVGIGTNVIPAGYKLAVDGNIIAEELKIQLSGTWPDYVFQEGYDLLPLKEVEAHIQSEGHLPNIPNAAEVEANGISVGDMQRRMMEKIEELTLYLIEQEKQIKALQKQLTEWESK